MDENERGLLIVFEGTDGTGKSTQIELLSQYLRNRGHELVVTREPTNGIYGQKIRQLYLEREKFSPEDELQLFINDRKEHVENLLRPSLKAGKIVLCDRYYLSTVAYQGAIGFDVEELFDLNSFAPEPDLALLFRAPLTMGINRITSGRGETPNDFEKQEYLTKVASIFDSLDYPFITPVDASKSIEEVHEQVLNHVFKLLPQTQQAE